MTTSDAEPRFSVDRIVAQIDQCLRGWGMRDDQALITARVIADANVCGLDSHGISTLSYYHAQISDGLIAIDAEVDVPSESSVSAIVDAGGGLGHMPSVVATNLAIKKANDAGVAVVIVRNSSHFGAGGYYTRLMADAGVIGLATTNGSLLRMAPTFGAEPKLSSNPLSFAAPGSRNPAFSLDMATTTVAAGKVRMRALDGLDIPAGWLTGRDGRPVTDASAFLDNESDYMLTPLGGSAEGASFKGYGLAAMVEILSGCLTGADRTRVSPETATRSRMQQGHFFLAIDPRSFLDDGQFEARVDGLVDELHSTTPLDESRPVMVPGEPEYRTRDDRMRLGIPISAGVRSRIRQISQDLGVSFLLE